MKAKLERSRQSARECRARKKLRYQYLEELVASRERSVFQLRSELEQVIDQILNFLGLEVLVKIYLLIELWSQRGIMVFQ